MPNPKGKHLMNGKETNKGRGLDANPQNINKKGRPTKGISIVNQELADAGYSPATKNDIEVNYMSLIQLSQSELTKITGDMEKPMLVRIIAKAMLSGKGFDIIEKMLDRGIGKAKQTEEANIKIAGIGLFALSEEKRSALGNLIDNKKKGQ